MDGRLIAGAVALVVLGVGAFLVLDDGDEPDPRPPPRTNALQQLWQVRVDADLGLSAWVQRSRLVLSDGSGIHGHDPRHGRKLWGPARSRRRGLGVRDVTGAERPGDRRRALHGEARRVHGRRRGRHSRKEIAIVPFAWDATRLYVLRRSLSGATVAAYRRRG